MERRTFLKMLGLGAGALVTPKFLLGSAEAAVEAPVSGLAKSWVVMAPNGIGAGASAVLAEEFVITPEFAPGVNPHEVFYKAALELQKRLGRETMAKLMEVPEWGRRYVEVVTTVFQPIHARSRGCWEDPEVTDKWTDEDWQGFDVVADCAIEVKGYGFRGREERGANYGHGWTPPAGQQVYSTAGEYPMELPSNLDLGHLMSIDRKFFGGDLQTANRLKHLRLVT